jgi:hypothetical protein
MVPFSKAIRRHTTAALPMVRHTADPRDSVSSLPVPCRLHVEATREEAGSSAATCKSRVGVHSTRSVLLLPQ